MPYTNPSRTTMVRPHLHVSVVFGSVSLGVMVQRFPHSHWYDTLLSGIRVLFSVYLQNVESQHWSLGVALLAKPMKKPIISANVRRIAHAPAEAVFCIAGEQCQPIPRAQKALIWWCRRSRSYSFKSVIASLRRNGSSGVSFVALEFARSVNAP